MCEVSFGRGESVSESRALCECEEIGGGGGDGAESACERQPREPKKRQQQKTCLPPLWRSLLRSL